jgi:hypothetical protein
MHLVHISGIWWKNHGSGKSILDYVVSSANEVLAKAYRIVVSDDAGPVEGGGSALLTAFDREVQLVKAENMLARLLSFEDQREFSCFDGSLFPISCF